jgi:site-specific DNA recombinase
MTERHRKSLRCAVYTRKSSEEGLEQEFNSLEAQREACEAYIRSQAHEGWRLVPDRFDDGGFSGGSLERPALQTLLDLVREHRVDVIVIYKIDRLTRSLMDFAKLAELFDKEGVSFVSVTQQFNTTTSMGRLMLNVLLSFAQFEREITGERIRDKIAASKKKGIWMGGTVPVGYDVKDRQLVVNEAEAETVRTLFRLYLKHGTVKKVWDEAGRLGLKTKPRPKSDGRILGGKRFFPGHIYTALKCPIYIGRIPHKGQSYQGNHESIVDQELWDAVQARLAQNRRDWHSYAGPRLRSPLAGLLFDAKGTRFTPHNTVKKNGQRYRYYIDQALARGIAPVTADIPRIPALEIEGVVRKGIGEFLGDTPKLLDAVGDEVVGIARERALKQAANLVKELRAATPSTWMPLVRATLQRIVIEEGAIRLHITPMSLRSILATPGDPGATVLSASGENDEKRVYQYVIPAQIRVRAGVMKLVIRNGDNEVSGEPDMTLVKMVARARVWAEMLKSGKVNSVRNIADRERLTESYVTRVLRLGFLAPEIVEGILDGRSAVGCADYLRAEGTLSMIWAEQP